MVGIATAIYPISAAMGIGVVMRSVADVAGILSANNVSFATTTLTRSVADKAGVLSATILISDMNFYPMS
jgi:hypothetical protein